MSDRPAACSAAQGGWPWPPVYLARQLIADGCASVAESAASIRTSSRTSTRASIRSSTGTSATGTTARPAASRAARTARRPSSTQASGSRAPGLDRQRLSLELLAIHLLNGCLGLCLRRHLYKTEASGLTGGSIPEDSDARDIAKWLECLAQFILACVHRDVSNIDVHLAFPLQRSETCGRIEIPPALIGVIRRHFSCERPSS
jgi:hypothetical protein